MTPSSLRATPRATDASIRESGLLAIDRVSRATRSSNGVAFEGIHISPNLSPRSIRGSTGNNILEVVVEQPISPRPKAKLPKELRSPGCCAGCTWQRILALLFLLATILAATIILVVLLQTENGSPRDLDEKKGKSKTSLKPRKKKSQPLQQQWVGKVTEGLPVYVMLHGLERNEFNGNVGKLDKYIESDNRWVCNLKTMYAGGSLALEGDEIKVAIKPHNLAQIDENTYEECGAHMKCDPADDDDTEDWKPDRPEPNKAMERMARYEQEQQQQQPEDDEDQHEDQPRTLEEMTVAEKAWSAAVSFRDFMKKFMTEKEVTLPAMKQQDAVSSKPRFGVTVTPLMMKRGEDVHLPAEVDGLHQMIVHDIDDDPSVYAYWGPRYKEDGYTFTAGRGCTVLEVMKDTYAEKVGMYAGDIFTHIKVGDGDFKKITERPHEDIVQILKGYRNERITLKFRRINDDAIHEYVKGFGLQYEGSHPGIDAKAKKAGTRADHSRRRALLSHSDTHEGYLAVTTDC